MQCEHAQEFISEYVTGEMDTALAVSLENHLNICPICQDMVDGLRLLWTTLDQLPTVDPPPAFHDLVMKRITDEEIAADRAAAPKPRMPSWRALLQPRSLAYAAVLLVLLLSAELVQVQRAALGPLGLVMKLIHPVPLLQAQSVEWMPNGQGGGTLKVRLQAHARVNGAVQRLHYHLQLDRKDGAAAPIRAMNPYREGDLVSGLTAVAELPLNYTPSDNTDALTITLTPAESGSQESQTIPIPLSPSP